MDELRRRVDELGEYVVFAGPDDPSAGGDVRSRLDAVVALGPSMKVIDAVLAILPVLGRLEKTQGPGRAEIMVELRRKVTDLQTVASGGAPTPSESRSIESSSAPHAWPKEPDTELLGQFVAEAREHLDATDVHLLTLESAPGQAEALNAVFRAFHTIKGAAGYLELGAIQTLAHETETLLDLARRGALVLSGAPLDATFESVDVMKALLGDVAEFLKSGRVPTGDATLGALIVRLRGLAGGSPAPAAPVAEASVPPVVVPVPAVVPVAEAAPALRDGRESGLRESVKVDAERLDRLVDLIGELVIAESMVSQSRDLRGMAQGGGLSKQVAQLDKITRELQEMGMSLRMMAVRPLFQRMARVARDLSKKLGKPVDFATHGEDIEVDKAVVDRVADPLIHIIRNALDHGIEERPEDRAAAGKPPAGKIELRAFHREGNLVLEIADDGRGMDRDAILAKGIEKGLVRKGDALTDDEIYALVFLPGFSTAKVVTEVSGRGVGMDVVRKNIEGLRGHIEIESFKGKGSVIRLRLPLTLAIIEGMVLRVAGERYIVPTLSVTKLVRPEPSQISTTFQRGEMLLLQGELLPIFRLHRLLRVGGAEPDATGSVAVVVEDGGRRAALLADELIGQQQIVIKSLGDGLDRVPGMAGAAILPDGQVGLILDVAGVLKRATARDASVAEAA